MSVRLSRYDGLGNLAGLWEPRTAQRHPPGLGCAKGALSSLRDQCAFLLLVQLGDHHGATLLTSLRKGTKFATDTIGFIEHSLSFVDNNTTPHTKDLHVVERWKLTDAGNALEAIVTVEDPGAFKAPWSGMARLQKVNRPIEEWACAENNLGYEQSFKLQEYPMPVANTPDF